MAENAIPNVMAFPLTIAMARLEKLGVSYEIIRTLPPKRREEFIWRDEDAYVLKQTIAPDYKAILLVGCKCRKEV